MLEAAKQMPEVVARLRLECVGVGVDCRGGIATRCRCLQRYFRFMSDECKARNIKIRGQC
jgi:hypothetical protein